MNKIGSHIHGLAGFLAASVVKNLPTMQETKARSLSGKGPLEEGMATHSSILAMDREAWRVTVQRAAESDTAEATKQQQQHVDLHAWSTMLI